MRSLFIAVLLSPSLMAQVYALDPEYVIPHEDPFASPSDVQTGERNLPRSVRRMPPTEG